MKRIILPFFGLCLAFFMSCCSGETHFITDESYRARVAQDLEQKKTLLPKGDLFAILDDTSLSLYEREALEFLYAYMPLPDIADFSGEFYLENIRASQRAADEMPWGKIIPEDVFRHFVLPVRINNEQLDGARMVFYEELKDRVRTLSMYDAILEVNHWCHEKAVYQPSDARTSSPLATVRTAFGRCGEESTLLVAALRSVGIPARQVYTPRWAHTDDNHAWVEAWADGKWHFLGACEPEPVLDLGWFNAPASRGMLMHTRVFGYYQGKEDVMEVTPNHTEINITENYAPTAEVKVLVTDVEGNPVSGACVEFKLYNYAEFYTVATKYTSAEGFCSLTAGKGDMLVWASKDGSFAFSKVTFGKQDELSLKLDKKEGDLFAMDIDVVPPVENANLPVVTPEQRAENDRRILLEDSIRNAYTSTFMDEEKARKFVHTFSGLSSEEEKLAVQFLVASYGNHEILSQFLTQASNDGKLSLAIRLLGVVSAKDLRDVSFDVLTDHLLNTPECSSKHYADALLNPRVATEALTPYKEFFQRVISGDLADSYRAEPQQLVEWCKDSITLNDTLNVRRVPMSPEGVWKARVADRLSRDIFFVSLARSLGIPAWIDKVTGKVFYEDLQDKNTVYDVDFDAGLVEQIPPSGHLTAMYKATPVLDDPKYYTHFSISKCVDGRLQLQGYNEALWSTLLKSPKAVSEGYYVMTSGTRLANGGVLAHVRSFEIKQGQITRIPLVMRESKDEIQVIGSFNAETLFTPLEKGKEAVEPISFLTACGRGYYVVGILGPGQEPTNHALKDIAKLGKDLEKWGRKMVLLFPNADMYKRYHIEDFSGLPSTIIYGIDSFGAADQIADEMKLRNRESLPIFIITDTFNRVVFVSQGYTIGLGEQLMRTIRGL